MATLLPVCRLSARKVSGGVRKQAVRREFHAQAARLAAQNFTMPALSPTMTEGNIAKWNVKEGDSFSAGDVLLEIETDKATMDVEAQDDGVLFKIFSSDGSKSVPVGSRIAVMAEPGDDLASLSVPPESDSQPAGQPVRTDRPSPQEEPERAIKKSESSESAAEASPSSKSNAEASAGGAADTAGASRDSAGTSAGTAHKQHYPLYPSVQHLLHEKGHSQDEADKIQATGPNGRLLKGDVLAYLGRIGKSYPAEQSKRIAEMGHLDLSHIQLAAPAKRPDAPREAAPEPPSDTEVAMPISLTSVIATQQRVQDSLGIFMPLSTFIARASELANEALPLSRTRTLSSDELFNSILGLDQLSPRTSRGAFVPQVTGLPPVNMAKATPKPKTAKKSDIIDMLTAKPAAPNRKQTMPRLPGISAERNVFSVTAHKGDEKRAKVFLGRMKGFLEAEPGRLVL
ncbi:pyridoxine biosynthesis protein [Elasticomyces elasticus]|nr:pyridoxine biosynthesis protein [Elasticomyces elasticus]